MSLSLETTRSIDEDFSQYGKNVPVHGRLNSYVVGEIQEKPLSHYIPNFLTIADRKNSNKLAILPRNHEFCAKVSHAVHRNILAQGRSYAETGYDDERGRYAYVGVEFEWGGPKNESNSSSKEPSNDTNTSNDKDSSNKDH